MASWVALRDSYGLIFFLLQSIIITVRLEVSPCAGKKVFNNLPESRTLGHFGNRRPGLAIKGSPVLVNGNTGQVHGTGGLPNGGSGIIHGENNNLINTKFLGESGQSKNSLLSQRFSNLVQKHGLGIRGGTNGNIHQSQQVNTEVNPNGSLTSSNYFGAGTPSLNTHVASAGGAGFGTTPTVVPGSIFLHSHRPHHGHHGSSNLVGSGLVVGGNLHHSHHLSHHGAIGNHFSSQGATSNGHHHFNHGGLSSINGGVGGFSSLVHIPHHHSGLGLVQGGGVSATNGGGGAVNSHLNHNVNRPHPGGLGLIYGNSGNHVSVSNNNLITVGPSAVNSRPNQGLGGLLGLIHNRPGVGINGNLQYNGGGTSSTLGHHGGLGLIHSGQVGNFGTVGNSYQHGGGSQFGHQQGNQGAVTIHGGQPVVPNNSQSNGIGVNSFQISNQQNLQQGGLSNAGMTSHGQSTGYQGGGISHGYQRPQGVIYEVHWSQPAGYSKPTGFTSANIQSQSHPSSVGSNQNINGNLNQGNLMQNVYGNNQLSQSNQYNNQGMLSSGENVQAQQGILISKPNNSFQSQGGHQSSNIENTNNAGNTASSSGNYIYGQGISQGSSGQEYNNVGGQNIGESNGAAISSTPNTVATTQLQGTSGQISGYGNGFASGGAYGTEILQSQGNNGQAYNSESGLYSGINSGQFNSMQSGYYSGTGSSDNTNTYDSGIVSQTQGSNGQYNTGSGVSAGTNGGTNYLSQSSTSNLQSHASSANQGSGYINGNYLESNVGQMQSSAHGAGFHQNQGSSSQQHNNAGSQYTTLNTDLSGNQFHNVGSNSQIQGHGVQSSGFVGGYFTGTNSNSNYATSSVSQTQGSSNHVSNTASQNYVSSNTGNSGTSSFGSSSQSQSEVSNTAGSSANASGGESHSSTNSYGGSFLVAANIRPEKNDQGQSLYSQTTAWTHKKPINQQEGSLSYEGNFTVIDSQDKKNNDLSVSNIQNAVYSDEYVEDSEVQSAQAGSGSTISGSNSASFVANGNISGDKVSHASGSLGTGSSSLQTQQEYNSAGMYHTGSAGSAGTNGQYSSSQSSLSNGMSQLGMHHTGAAGSAGTSGHYSPPQTSPESMSQFGLYQTGSAGSAGTNGHYSPPQSSTSVSTSHEGHNENEGSSTPGSNLESETGLSTQSHLSGVSGSNMAQNYETNDNSQLYGSNQHGLTVQNNKELNNTLYSGSTGIGNASAGGLYGSSNLGGIGTGSQSFTNGTYISSGTGHNIMNNENMPFNSNISNQQSSHHITHQGINSNNNLIMTGSNNFQTSQNTGSVYEGNSNSLASQSSFGSQQTHNTENTGNYNFNNGVTSTGEQYSENSNHIYKPSSQSSVSSGGNTYVGISENQSSKAPNSELPEDVNNNSGVGNSQFSGSTNSNSQYISTGMAGSGIYSNEGNSAIGSNNHNTLSSSIGNSGQASESTHEKYTSSQTINPSLQWESGASSHNTQGVQSLEGNSGINNAQYTGTNNFGQSQTLKPSHGGSSNLEVDSSIHSEQQTQGSSVDLQQPTAQTETSTSFNGNNQLSSSSSANIKENGNKISSTSINTQGGYGSGGSMVGSGSYSQNGATETSSVIPGGTSSFHTQGELHGGSGTTINKQSQGSLHFSHFFNPIQYTERYVYIPEMTPYNVDTSRVGNEETESSQGQYITGQTSDGSYLISNLAPVLGTGQVENQGGKITQTYYIHQHLPKGHNIDHTETSVIPTYSIDNIHATGLQGNEGIFQQNTGGTGDLPGHLGKQGNFQGLLNIPSRIVGVLSGVGNSLGGLVGQGISGGFQGNAEHSGEVNFEGGVSHYPGFSGSIHGNFENHISGSGSVEGSADQT